MSLEHQFHLQGHDSAVKCVDYCRLSDQEIMLVSAGGKANIKIWKVVFKNDLQTVEKITHLYEFKRFIKRTLNTNEKPWLYVDLKSNPDIRFMDVVICKHLTANNEFIICFACSDGFVRIFRYKLDTNKLFLVDKYEYNKCLFRIKHLTAINGNIQESYLVCFGTDGKLLKWKLNLDEQNKNPPELHKISGLHQSGINSVDIWEDAMMPSGKYLVATVGDDTRISILELDLNSNASPSEELSGAIKVEMAHASSIVDCKFLRKDVLASVSKDQRLAIWEIDYDLRKVFANFF